MPKVTEAHRLARREEILDAALQCFARSGYQRISMLDIIDASGLSAGTIYGYFASKQELATAVAARVLDARRVELGMDADGQVAARSPAEIVTIIVRGLERSGIVPMAVHTWGEAVNEPEIRAVASRVLNNVRATLRDSLTRWAALHHERIPDDRERWVEHTVTMVLALVQGFALQRTLIDDFDDHAYVHAATELLPS